MTQGAEAFDEVIASMTVNVAGYKVLDKKLQDEILDTRLRKEKHG